MMRVSTSMFFETGTRTMLERQSALLRIQEQLSTGRRILVPSDDPIASSQALRVRQERDVTAQFAANLGTARDSLSVAEAAVGSVQDNLAAIRETLLAAGNAALTDADRRSLALDLQSRFEEALATARRRDATGRYLFAGYLDGNAPFVDDGTTVTYAGDLGVRAIAIAPARNLAVGVHGAALFESIATGNGTFVTAVAAGNAGNASFGTGSVYDASLVTGDSYEVVFTVAAGVTTYDVVNTTLGVTVSSGNAYADGASVSVGGQQATMRGTPATGDRFTLSPAPAQSLFRTLREAIATLEAPLASPAAQGRFQTDLARAVASLDQASERTLAVRTRLGSGLREVDATEALQSGLVLEQDRQLSRLEDLDYAKAISEFTREQQALEAAQKAFRATTQLSLFDLL